MNEPKTPIAELGISSGNNEKVTAGRDWRAMLPKYPERPLMIFLSFLAFVVVRYIQIGARRDILATIRFEFLVGILVLVLVSIELANRKPEIGRSQPLLILMALLLFAMIIQLPMAASPVVARKIFWDRVVKFALLTYFMIVMIESPRRLKWFLAAFIFSLFYITQESVRGLISGGLVWQNQGIMRLHGAVPIYEHPNSLSGAAMGLIPFIIFLWPNVRSWTIKLGLLVATGTSLTCVVYSGSRTAYLGFIALVLLWWFHSKKKWRFLFRGIIAGLILISILPDQYIERFESIGGQEKEGHSKEGRILILKDAWIILNENPAGVGVASFPIVRLRKFGRYADTHNLYLEVATNLGYQGLLIFLGLVFVMIYRIRTVGVEFEKQIKVLIVQMKGDARATVLGRTVWQHILDLRYLTGVAKAANGFIIIRLILGVFGMDLYEVYWWFGAGLAIVLSGLVVRTSRKTEFLLRECTRISDSAHG